MLLKTLISLLLLAYPVIVYYGLTHGMAWAGLVLLCLFFVQKAILSKNKRLQYIFMIVLLGLGAWLQQTTTIKLLPVVIHSALLVLFWQSLRSGVSIIERFARIDFDEMPPGIPQHCYRMTQIWIAFFMFNVVFCSYLAVWGSDKGWALYNGLVVYGLLAMLIVGEYIWRRMKFPHLEMSSFKETISKISKGGHHIWGRD